MFLFIVIAVVILLGALGMSTIAALLLFRRPKAKKTDKTEPPSDSKTVQKNAVLSSGESIDTVPCLYNDCFYLLE